MDPTNKILIHLNKAPTAKAFHSKKWVKKSTRIYCEWSDVSDLLMVLLIGGASLVVSVFFLQIIVVSTPLFSMIGKSLMLISGIISLIALPVLVGLVVNKWLLDCLSFRHHTLAVSKQDIVAMKNTAISYAQTLQLGPDVFNTIKLYASDALIPCGWWVKLNKMLKDLEHHQNEERMQQKKEENHFDLCQKIHEVQYQPLKVVSDPENSRVSEGSQTQPQSIHL